MATEVRAAEPGEMDAFLRVRGYAFADHENAFPSVPPELSLCAFVDGELASTTAAWPFTMRWNGAAVAAAGVTMVATSPAFRRRGLLHEIMRVALPSYRERGQPIAILWASFGAIYQRFGFGPASDTVFYTFDPRLAQLEDARPAPGRIELLRAADALEHIKPLYQAYATPRTLLLHRGDLMWQFGILREPAGDGVFVALYLDDADTPRGYAVYQTVGTPLADNRWPDHMPPVQELRVRDWVALDGDAQRGLWQFLLHHDLAHTIRMGPLPSDDPAPLLLAEPRRLIRRTNDGIWLRVIDAEAALAARRYAVPDELSIEVREDRACDWNNATFRITAGPDGRADVARVKTVPDVIVSPRPLATLLAGRASAHELARAGLLEAKDPAMLRRADRLLRTDHPPHCPDAF